MGLLDRVSLIYEAVGNVLLDPLPHLFGELLLLLGVFQGKVHCWHLQVTTQGSTAETVSYRRLALRPSGSIRSILSLIR